MNRTWGIVLVVWNVVLTALLALVWYSTEKEDGGEALASPVPSTELDDHSAVMDSIKRGDSRIAFFFMDSVQQDFVMVKEKGELFRSEGQRLENQLKQKLARSEARYQELMTKDHTYSTKAEIQADEQEVQNLMNEIQVLQQRGQEQMANMEVNMLEEISEEIMDFLAEHNERAGYEYIFSVQSGGQIWVGDPAVDLTRTVVDGLNARYLARKKVPATKEP
ncbi:MAG: OmpH family outer membrane protein [Flavobacteriales bacterium]|nr:OmpH family outer membrane protein [Flavobacteriales bacterium]